jgi:CheY-like chemotaxis protein
VIDVLVADDEKPARDEIVHLLRTDDRVGEILVAESGAEALRMLRDEDVNILISDIGMPDFDGYQLIKKVRTLDKGERTLPAIALTAYARSDDRQRALLAGFQMHLAKPVEPRELVAGIASLLNLPAKAPPG